MRYRFHEGIVFTRISNVSLLVATRKAWDQFPAVKTLSPIYGWFAWGINNGLSIEELENNEELLKKLNKEILVKKLKEFTDSLTRENYLISVEDNSAES